MELIRDCVYCQSHDEKATELRHRTLTCHGPMLLFNDDASRRPGHPVICGRRPICQVWGKMESPGHSDEPSPGQAPISYHLGRGACGMHAWLASSKRALQDDGLCHEPRHALLACATVDCTTLLNAIICFASAEPRYRCIVVSLWSSTKRRIAAYLASRDKFDLQMADRGETRQRPCLGPHDHCIGTIDMHMMEQ